MSLSRTVAVPPEMQALFVCLVGVVAAMAVLQAPPLLAVVMTIAFGAAFAAYVRLRGDAAERRLRREQMGLGKPDLAASSILLLCVAAIALPAPLTIVSDWLTAGRVHHGNPALVGTAAVSRMLAVIIATPFVEELSIRGLLLRSLRGRVGVVAAAVLSALLYAAGHGNPLLVPYYTTLGLVLAAVTLRAASIWPAVLMHGAFNSGVLMIDAIFGSSAAYHRWWDGIGGAPAAAVTLAVLLAAVVRVLGREGAKSGSMAATRQVPA